MNTLHLPRPADLAERREPASVLLVRPTFFDVVDVKNPYMEGSTVDRERAMRQWDELHGIYDGLAEAGVLDSVQVMPGVEDLEDMVFCANQSLPWLDAEGRRRVIISRMRHASRQREVPYFRTFYKDRGYHLHELPDDMRLEGMGDCIFHPFRKLVWMGYGFRTSGNAAGFAETTLGMPVIPLRLVSEHFYHLDTCFLPVSEETVLLCEDAFDGDSLEAIRSVFSEVVHVPLEAAAGTFSLNTHCIYHREHPTAVVPEGAKGVTDTLQAAGYTVHFADTSEFIKSGGSVFCMKMMVY